MTSPTDIARARIAEEDERRTGSLDLSIFGLEALPDEVSGLSHLQRLDCSNSPIADLEPLRGLTGLHQLDCSATMVGDLAPLRGLTGLQQLYCFSTRVADLAPLRGLTALHLLDCSITAIADLAPLRGLTALQQLYCSNSLLADLAPMSALTGLQQFHCSKSLVGDLAPLRGLTALQQLGCSRTEITDLAPLRDLTALRYLDFSWCRLREVPASIRDKPSLHGLFLYGCPMPGIPRKILSQHSADNCLERIRAHFADLATKAAALPDISPPLLNNVPLGKTQSIRQEKPAQSKWYVSYAWGDDRTPEGLRRERIVDDLCTAAEADGHLILRDRNVLSLGDSISDFMRRIGEGDRVFVILSDKYLRSPFCMYELNEIWRTCRHEASLFCERVRVYTLGDADIWRTVGRLRYAAYWKREHDEVEALVREHGLAILGDRDHAAFRRMTEFSRHTADILATLADLVQPRSFEELKQHGFA